MMGIALFYQMSINSSGSRILGEPSWFVDKGMFWFHIIARDSVMEIMIDLLLKHRSPDFRKGKFQYGLNFRPSRNDVTIYCR